MVGWFVCCYSFRVIELSYYNSEALSVLFKADIISEDINQSMSYGVAQLPINALLSLPLIPFNDTVLSEKALELLVWNTCSTCI